MASWDASKDFLDANPKFKVFFPNVDSQIMWAIAYVYHPESPYRNETVDNKRKIVAEDWLQDAEFDWDSIQDLVTKFEKECLTKKERILSNWEQKLDERDVLLASIPYTIDTAEFLDKSLAASTKLWEGYMKAVKDVEAEMSVYITGNSAESALESGLI